MGDCCQMGVATLLTCLVLQATVGVAQQGPQSYYWSRNRGDSSHFSQRSSHIGPLPHVNDVMTEWSRWSPWDRCSRVMPGSGVRTSHDRCAGGDSVEYGVCGVAQCPPAQVSGLSFRAAQCRHYNNKRVFGRLVNNWVPYTQGIQTLPTTTHHDPPQPVTTHHNNLCCPPGSFGYYEVTNIPRGSTNVSPDTSPPIVVPLPPADTSTTTTPATTTSSSTSTTTTATTITSATAPRPAILTGVNVTRFHKPPLTRTRPPQRSENEIHTPKKPKKPKSKGDGKGQRGRKRKKGQRGKKGKERKGKTEKKQRGRKGKKGGGGKKKLDVPPTCGPCEKPRRQTKHMFCTSDFVSRVEVVGSEAVGGERRLEVVVHQSYKNTVPLLHKEFLWITNPCQCPLLRHGRSYLVMGVTEPTGGREVRLVLTRSSYVRRYKPRNLARILRIRHNEMRFCRPWRRDLRFVQTTSLNSTIPATT
ncbi:ADAMTS-like protein 5-like [Homarus americanus]|uniref:ADAMTS-like protein 5-like n=1 Tax=Homarus americanus TaxID=6706 RepID=A0A8J5K730_HOMAM|nr:ADAMTS-like protein 5-like [Homarus americanus]